jgi:hypothetical protein
MEHRLYSTDMGASFGNQSRAISRLHPVTTGIKEKRTERAAKALLWNLHMCCTREKPVRVIPIVWKWQVGFVGSDSKGELKGGLKWKVKYSSIIECEQ